MSLFAFVKHVISCCLLRNALLYTDMIICLCSHLRDPDPTTQVCTLCIRPKVTPRLATKNPVTSINGRKADFGMCGKSGVAKLEKDSWKFIMLMRPRHPLGSICWPAKWNLWLTKDSALTLSPTTEPIISKRRTKRIGTNGCRCCSTPKNELWIKLSKTTDNPQMPTKVIWSYSGLW